MKRVSCLVMCFLFMTIIVNAQSKSTKSSSYKTALGVKAWDGAGISFKHFFHSKDAVELTGYFWGHGMRLTGLYEIHTPIANVTGLKWYIGPGAHIGFYNTNYGDGVFAGIDGVLGLDYKFKSLPLNMSVDWQPAFEFGNNRGFVGNWGGLGIRYTF